MHYLQIRPDQPLIPLLPSLSESKPRQSREHWLIKYINISNPNVNSWIRIYFFASSQQLEGSNQ